MRAGPDWWNRTEQEKDGTGPYWGNSRGTDRTRLWDSTEPDQSDAEDNRRTGPD
jgi:hypothetical protein